MALDLDSIDFAAIAAKERRRRRSGWLALGTAVLISAVWVVPFYYLAVSVFKTTEQYSQNHPLSLPGELDPVIDNAVTAWTNAKMGGQFTIGDVTPCRAPPRLGPGREILD